MTRDSDDGRNGSGMLSDFVARVLRDAERNGRVVDAPPIENVTRTRAIASGSVSRALLEELGWPRRALDHAETSYESHAIEIVRSHGDREGILVLSGEKGSGKTVAAAAWAMARNTGTSFVTAMKYARTSRFSEVRDRIIGGCRALVLDDLGAEYADDKGSFVADLDELVNAFYSDRRRLIITTNCDSVQFAERYGERISDRLAECGEWHQVLDSSMRAATRVPWET